VVPSDVVAGDDGGEVVAEVVPEPGDSGGLLSVLPGAELLVVGEVEGGTSDVDVCDDGEGVGVCVGGTVGSHSGRSAVLTNSRICSLALSRLPMGRPAITCVRSEGRKSLTLSR
jgi:hypothetical protein